MDPSWLKLGLCWPQVDSNLAQVGPMLGPFAGPQPPLGQHKPFQTASLLPLGLPSFTRALQDPKQIQSAKLYGSDVLVFKKHNSEELQGTPSLS